MLGAIPPFHVAVPVDDLEKARQFYRDVLECEEGRSAETWVDMNLYGHQFVLHHKPSIAVGAEDGYTNAVDGKDIPVPHYGVVLEWSAWQDLASRLETRGITFVIEPYIRFAGEVGEQATMFFYDPAGNALEFKAFKDPEQLFARD